MAESHHPMRGVAVAVLPTVCETVVTVIGGNTMATFEIDTPAVTHLVDGMISASYSSIIRTARLTIV